MVEIVVSNICTELFWGFVASLWFVLLGVKKIILFEHVRILFIKFCFVAMVLSGM